MDIELDLFLPVECSMYRQPSDVLDDKVDSLSAVWPSAVELALQIIQPNPRRLTAAGETSENSTHPPKLKTPITLSLTMEV